MLSYKWHRERRHSDAEQMLRRTNYLHLEYLRELQSSSRVPHMRLIHAANRLFSQALSYLTCIDVCSHSDLDNRIDWSSPEDVQHLKQYNPVIGWKLFPGPITLALRWLGVRPFKSSAWKQRQRHLWISRLVRVLYFTFNFHILVNLYFQYLYDFDRIKLITMSKKLQEKQQNQDDTTELELNIVLLTNRSRETKLMLDLIGAPTSNWTFTVECLYIYILICGFTIHYIVPLLHSLVTPFNMHIGRELLDEQNERHHFEKLIRAQVSSYIESHRVFDRVFSWKYLYSTSHAVDRASKFSEALIIEHVDQIQMYDQVYDQSNQRADQLDRCRQRAKQLEATAFRLVAMRASTAGLDKDFMSICNSLNSMLARGVLKPFNKSTGSMERRSLVMALCHIGLYFYGSAMIYALIYCSLERHDPSRPLNVQDYLLLNSLFCLFFITGYSINLQTTYFLVACRDQIVAVKKVRELLIRCIRANSFEFNNNRQSREHGHQRSDLLASNEAKDDSFYLTGSSRFGGTRDPMRRVGKGASKLFSHRDIMSTNLLFVLMQYKIFVAQYLPFKKTFKSFIVYMTVFSIAMPLLLRIHLAYMKAFNVQDISTFIMIWTVGTMILADINSFPVSHLYSRCVDLYHALSSLMAHLISIESDPNGRNLYNPHAITMVIKELESAQSLMDQFKTGSLGLTWTYTTLVKTQFWRGLIVLSILADKQFSEQGLVGSIFRDPFRLF